MFITSQRTLKQGKGQRNFENSNRTDGSHFKNTKIRFDLG